MKSNLSRKVVSENAVQMLFAGFSVLIALLVFGVVFFVNPEYRVEKVAYACTPPTATPLPDDSWIIAYVAPGYPFEDFPGHAWVKVYRPNTDRLFNNKQMGWWPTGNWFWSDGEWRSEPCWNPSTIQEGIYCNSWEASDALYYMETSDTVDTYSICSYNCVHTSKAVFSYGYDGTIPSTTSWWTCGWVDTPEAWGQWLEDNI